jgi:hypothetical protein
MIRNAVVYVAQWFARKRRPRAASIRRQPPWKGSAHARIALHIVGAERKGALSERRRT